MDRQQQQRVLRECRVELDQCHQYLDSAGPSQTESLLHQRIRNSRHRIKHLNLAIAAGKHSRDRQRHHLRSIQGLKQDIANMQSLTGIEVEQSHKLARIATLLKQQIRQTQLKIEQVQTQQEEVDYSLKRHHQHINAQHQLHLKQQHALQIEQEMSQVETMRSQVAKQKVNTLLTKKREVLQLQEQLSSLQDQIHVQREVIAHITSHQYQPEAPNQNIIAQEEEEVTELQDKLSAFEQWEVGELLGKKRELQRRQLLHGRILRQRHNNKSAFMGHIRNNRRHSYNHSTHPLQRPTAEPAQQPQPEQQTAPQTPTPVSRLEQLEKGKRIRTRESYNTSSSKQPKPNRHYSMTEPSQPIKLKLHKPPPLTTHHRNIQVIKITKSTQRHRRSQGQRGTGMELG